MEFKFEKKELGKKKWRIQSLPAALQSHEKQNKKKCVGLFFRRFATFLLSFLTGEETKKKVLSISH